MFRDLIANWPCAGIIFPVGVTVEWMGLPKSKGMNKISFAVGVYLKPSIERAIQRLFEQ